MATCTAQWCNAAHVDAYRFGDSIWWLCRLHGAPFRPAPAPETYEQRVGSRYAQRIENMEWANRTYPTRAALLERLRSVGAGVS